MNSSILNALTYLKHNFKQDWLKSYIETDDKLKPAELDKLITDTLSIVYDYFCLSVLKGEYVINKDFLEEINNLDDFLKTNFDDYIEDAENQEVYLLIVKKRLLNTISVFIKLYKKLFTLLETHNKHPKYDIINVSNPSLSEQITGEADIDKIKFFNIIIELNRLDHFFNVKIDTYAQLTFHENHLKKDTSFISKYKIVLLEKTQFLKYKWEVRQRTLFNENSSIKGSIIDSELTISTENTKNKTDNAKILEWQNYIESHYEIGDWKYKINSDINKLDISNPKSLNILQLHQLIKFYKDVNPNYNALKGIVEFIEKKRIDDNTEYYTYNKIYNYALNNQFSSLITQKNAKEDEIISLKEKIEALQIQCKTDNFFLEYKYIGYLIKKVEQHYDNRKELDEISSAKFITKDLRNLIQSCNEKLIWSHNHYNQLFALPFDECKVPTNVENLPYVYYASSFVLPLPLSETRKEFLSLEQRFHRINILIDSLTSLKKEFNTIKKIKKEIKLSDFRSIEILGIFTALITFIFGTISTYSFIETPYQAILFTGMFALSLLIFISFLLVFIKVKRLKKRWYLLLIPILLLGINWYFLNHFYNKDYSNLKSKNSTLLNKNDSIISIKLQTYRKSLDSLIILNGERLNQIDSIIIDSKIKK